MSIVTLPRIISSPRIRLSPLAAWAGARMALAWRNVTTRRSLAELDERMLKDLGISRAQAEFEASRPIWR